MPHTNPALSRLATLRLAHEAGWFAGERSRRRRGARGWSLADWKVAHEAFEVAMGGEPADEHDRRHGLADLQPLTADQAARLRKALAESPAAPEIHPEAALNAGLCCAWTSTGPCQTNAVAPTMFCADHARASADLVDQIVDAIIRDADGSVRK